MWHHNCKLNLTITLVQLQLIFYIFSSLLPVYVDGKVCISILHAPGEDTMSREAAAERWRLILNVEAILLSVILMINDPNILSPAYSEPLGRFEALINL